MPTRRVSVVMGAVAASAVAILSTSAPASAITVADHIWANQVNVRSCASTSCQLVATISAGNYPYSCTVKGQEVYYGNYYNYYWSKIDVDLNHDGTYETPAWVNDIFVSGGGNNQPAGYNFPC